MSTPTRKARRDTRNAARESKFVDSDVPPPHIAVDPNLAYAWALDRFVTTSETASTVSAASTREMAKYG
ncbi:hypothetical protein D1007_06501 [Hordeum vulgare]|nr:hypothetical protein D1007_06501 [Hordeum vulgare]